MSSFPRMLYRPGKAGVSDNIQGFDCDTLTVANEEDEFAAKCAGWKGSPALAHGEKGEQPPQDEAQSADPAALANLDAQIEDLKAQVESERARADGYEGQLADLRASAASDATAAEELLKAETEARIAAEAERDEARAALATFDRDADGKPGGSKKRG